MIRAGIGFDVHCLAKGRKLIIGGVEIPFEEGLLGHSDADVLVHAIMDGLLGAIGEKDIGNQFPDSEDKYRDISSLILLRQVYEKVKQFGYSVNNIDAIIIAQKPKMNPFIDDMKKNIASVLEISLSSLSIKSTTTEHLGFTGRGEGIAAQSVVTLRKDIV